MVHFIERYKLVLSELKKYNGQALYAVAAHGMGVVIVNWLNNDYNYGLDALDTLPYMVYAFNSFYGYDGETVGVYYDVERRTVLPAAYKNNC